MTPGENTFACKDVEHISIVWANPHTPSVDSPPGVDSKKAKKKKELTFFVIDV